MYKNMKISITDEVHLKDVCDVLESMGYVCARKSIAHINMVITSSSEKRYIAIKTESPTGNTTLTDLLKMRDEMVKKFNEEGFQHIEIKCEVKS